MAGVYVLYTNLLHYFTFFGCSYDWRMNLSALLFHFNNITKFPVLNDLQYKGPVLFLAGGKSDFIP